VFDVVFLVGGRSTEHDISVGSYLALLSAVQSDRAGRVSVRAVVYVDRQGTWHGFTGSPWPATETELRDGPDISPAELLALCRAPGAFVISLIYGKDGEDGAWQGIAQVLDLAGSYGGVLGAALSMDKFMMAAVVGSLTGGRLKTPRTWRFGRLAHVDLDPVIAECAPTGCVVKPNSMGSSILTEFLAQPSREAVDAAIAAIWPFDPIALVQEYVRGDEYTCGCILDDGGWTVLPIAQVHTSSGMLTHDDKASSAVIEASFVEPTSEPGRRLVDACMALCRDFDFSGIVRFDFIVDRTGSLYFLEANYLPGLTATSIFPAMLSHAGRDVLDVVEAFERSWLLRPTRRWDPPVS
jgi:D-alanine-D-alanine ligase